MKENGNMGQVISRYRDFFENKYGLYLLRILTECDLAEEKAAPQEFGPLYAAFYDESAPDNSLELYNYFSNQEEIIERHKEIHKFYDMIKKVISGITTSYKCNINGENKRFLSAKDPTYDDVPLTVSELILETLGAKQQVGMVLRNKGISDAHVKACTKRRRIALDKLYDRLYYNFELEIATYLDENRDVKVYDFKDQVCFDIMEIIMTEHEKGSDPLSKKEARQVLKNYFNKNIQKGLADISDVFYETINVSACALSLDDIRPQNNTCFNGEYKRVLPHFITNGKAPDGTPAEICTAPTRAYTCEYLLKLDGEIRKTSKKPLFYLEPGTSDVCSVQVLGVSDENQLYLAADASKAGLFDSKNTDFMKLLGAGKTSELRAISCYYLRVNNAMETLIRVNPTAYHQLGAIYDNPKLTYDALYDLYFLTKFV